MSSGGGRRFDSWKEIAEYLGREVRTVIRWEKERGLPVHRIPGGKRGGVFAQQEEIDRWLESATPTLDSRESHSDQPASSGNAGASVAGSAKTPAANGLRHVGWTVRRLWLLPAGLGAAILATLLWSGRSKQPVPPPVASVSLESGALLAKGPDGSALWKHTFGRSVLQVEDLKSSVIHQAADLDGDGTTEHLVNVPWGDASSVAPHELFCFSATGKPLWSVRLADEVVFGGGRYGPPWVGQVDNSQGKLVATYKIQGAQRIAWVQSHNLWWPAVLTILDSKGRTISKWVHAGNIQAVASLDGDPPVLLVVGTSNSRAAGFLALLDARDISGSGPEESGSSYECLSCSPGRPLRYFVFPPSELTLADLLPYNHGIGVRVLGDGFEVQTQEVEPRFRLMGIFRFSADFRLRHAAWSDGWLPTHGEFERQGKVDHTAQNCPEAKRSPRVLAWEPESGFNELPAVWVATASR